MKNFVFTLFALILVFIGCQATSNAVTKETATLTLFHTNDIMGYLTPCG
ncbi:hypothetical protein JXA70_07085 [candidate division KSB1 bacterium]|nr:hypothetical protein [candidate division KSB1 bacterium]